MKDDKDRTPDKIIELAKKMPSGLDDPKVLAKRDHEFVEWMDANEQHDRLGELLEAADVFYYSTKAEAMGVDSEMHRYLGIIVFISGFTFQQVYDACLIKYTMRSQPGNPKDDEAERKAVAHLLK